MIFGSSTWSFMMIIFDDDDDDDDVYDDNDDDDDDDDNDDGSDDGFHLQNVDEVVGFAWVSWQLKEDKFD